MLFAAATAANDAFLTQSYTAVFKWLILFFATIMAGKAMTMTQMKRQKKIEIFRYIEEHKHVSIDGQDIRVSIHYALV